MSEISQQVPVYLDYCRYQKKLNSKTIKAYSIDLAQFFSKVSGTAYKALKAEIVNYITHLHKTYLPRTAKRKLASVIAFFNYLEYEEILPDNPLHKIKTKFQEPKVLPRAIPLNAIEKILSAAYENLKWAATSYASHKALRDVTVVEMLFATGMRVSELCSLGAQDVDLEDGRVLIHGKGAKERVLQVGNSEVLALLRQYHEENMCQIAETGCFFTGRLGLRLSEQSVRSTLSRLCEQAGVPHGTPHMLRHSFATFLLEEDVDIRYIQRMLGHGSIQTTQIYTQVATAKQRQILELKHPRNKIVVRK